MDSKIRVKTGLAEMLKGGVIMDVTNSEQAQIAERAGAVAVMALERIPSDIRKEGGVARMAPIEKVREIQRTVSIPVMAKCRIGHFAEAQVLEALEVDFVDESEVLTPADEEHHVDKWAFKVPFVCGARDLGEALRRIAEGAALIRTKGEAGSGNIVEAVRHMRKIVSQMRRVTRLTDSELVHEAKELGSPVELVRWVRDHNRDAEIPRLPVPNFAAGGIATPADAALMMQLGAETVFVGSGIFASTDPDRRARAIVHAVLHYKDPKEVLAACKDLGDAMPGLDIRRMDEKDLLQTRGWWKEDSGVSTTTIGVLCLQGDYEAHGRLLERLGVAWRDVRRATDLDGLAGLVLPGGESTTMWHFLRADGFAGAIAAFAEQGGALYGTCAGAILLAREVRNPDNEGLGLLDIGVERNAYGRQVQSAVRSAVLDDVQDLDGQARPGDTIETVLIRAPRIERVGAGVRVRARLDGDPVWVEEGRVMATTFHPELGDEERPHRRFLQLAGARVAGPVGSV